MWWPVEKETGFQYTGTFVGRLEHHSKDPAEKKYSCPLYLMSEANVVQLKYSKYLIRMEVTANS